MTSRHRIWACTAVAVAGGLLSGGPSRWTAQVVFAGCALWLLCGPLLGQVALGALALGQLWQRAATVKVALASPALPYAQPNSPAARLQMAGHALAPGTAGDAPGKLLLPATLLTLAAAGGALILARFFAAPVTLLVSLALGLTLTLSLCPGATSAGVALLSATAWCSGLAMLGRLAAPRALVGLLAALLLGAVTHPTPGAGWRAAQVGGGLALAAALALAQQPALAGLLLVSALACLATPPRQTQPLTLQVTIALGALLVGLAVGHWG